MPTYSLSMPGKAKFPVSGLMSVSEICSVMQKNAGRNPEEMSIWIESGQKVMRIAQAGEE